MSSGASWQCKINELFRLRSLDDKIRRDLVYLQSWTLNLRPLMVSPKVLLPPNFIDEGYAAVQKQEGV